MDSSSYDRIQALFERAVEVPTARRAAFLTKECGSDTDLLREVESLLAADESAAGFLEDRGAAQELARRHEIDRVPEERDDLGPGALVGAWRLIDVVGSGGMGQVWRAERAVGRFEQRVALKVVKRGMDSTEIVERFQQERQTLAQLEHPFIARLLDGGVTSDGRPFLVMELVEGERIDRYCATHELDLDARLELFGKACRPVEHAHQRLVVHRDLKPGNILVNRDGDPKLLDFGIAKLLAPRTGREATGLTTPGNRVFTLEYASPEQVLGRPVTTASDVYSLGLVLFELLTGSKAYELRDRDFTEIERIVCRDAPRRPSEVADLDERTRRALRGDLDNIVLMALRKEPERRYASVGELREDLERFRRGLPVRAAPETTGYVARKFFLRHKAESLFALLAFAALVAGLVVSVRQTRRARAAESAEHRIALAESAARTRAQGELEQKREALEFFSAILGAGDLLLGKGPHTTLQQMLEAASDRLLRARRLAPDVEAEIRQMLGLAWQNAGELARAEKELARADELFASVAAEDDERRLDSRRFLAGVRGKLGRADDAIRELQALVPICERVCGKEDRRTLATKCDLCVALLDVGRSSEAAPLAKEVAAAFSRPSTAIAGGRDDYTRLWALHNLALALFSSGELESAEPIARRVFEARLRTLGESHDLTLLALHTLASIESERGGVEPAEADFLRLVELREKHFGAEHADTLAAKADLAIIYARRRDHPEALALQEQVLEAQTRKLGPSHRDTLFTHTNLVNSLRNLDRLDEACDHLDRILEHADATFPARSSYRAWVHAVAGTTYLRGGRTEEAEEQLKLAWEELGGEPALRDPASRERANDVVRDFIQLYDEWGMPEEALVWKKRASPLSR